MPDSWTPWPTRRQFLARGTGALTGLALGGGLLAACGEEEQEGEPQAQKKSLAPIRIATVPTIAPELIADEKGYFKEAGLEVSFVPASAFGSFTVQVVVQGEVETGPAVAFPAVLQARAAGAKVTSVLNEWISEPGNEVVRYYVMPDSDIRTGHPEDLKGKRLGIWGKGTLADIPVIAALNAAGLAAEDVTFTVVPVLQLGEALYTGSIDAVAAYNIAYGQIEADGRARLAFTDLDTPLPMASLNAVNVFSEEFAEENPDSVKAYVTGMLKGQRFMAENEEEAKAIIAERVDLDTGDLPLPTFDIPSCLDSEAANAWSAAMAEIDETIDPASGAAAVTTAYNPECS
jgi:NitT/TauT family transport system substrate-binding protein